MLIIGGILFCKDFELFPCNKEYSGRNIIPIFQNGDFYNISEIENSCFFISSIRTRRLHFVSWLTTCKGKAGEAVQTRWYWSVQQDLVCVLRLKRCENALRHCFALSRENHSYLGVILKDESLRHPFGPSIFQTSQGGKKTKTTVLSILRAPGNANGSWCQLLQKLFKCLFLPGKLHKFTFCH